MATIGQQLTGARDDLGLSVADVAHETRIHANVIRSIEQDDFSMFASTTYARSFLKKYSDYLDIDVSEEIAALDSGTEVSLKNSELMDQVRDTLQNNRLMRKEQPRRYRRRIEKPGGAPLFLGFILVLLFVSIGVFYFLGYKAESPEELKSEITKSLNKAGDLLKKEEKTVNPDLPAKDPALPANPLAVKKEDPATVKPKTSEPAIKGPPVAEVEAIKKPAVNMKLSESPLENPAAGTGGQASPAIALKPRQTPALELEQPAATPISNTDLPAIPRPATEDEDNESGTPNRITDQVENPQPPASERPPVRAVPVVSAQDGE